MLQRLQVSNYVLIDSLDIEFPGGLIIITGQTGAGKSLLMGAISLALGAKADNLAIAEGADNCVVEAEFQIDGADTALIEAFRENDLDWDNGHIIIRRMLSRAGRSRSFVNDIPVSQQFLSQISSRLVDIHSQHQTLMLSDRKFQLELLDRYAGHADLLAECAQSWKQICGLKKNIEETRERIERARRNREYDESRYARLRDAALKEGELESLEDEQKKLANAEEIKQVLCRCESLCEGQQDSGSLLNSLKEMRKGLDRLTSYIPETASLSERTESCRLELDDILSEIASINESFEVSPQRLEAVEDRISEIYTLLGKHSCTSVSQLIAERDALEAALADSTLLEDDLQDMEKKLGVELRTYSSICSSLHESRKKAAGPFSREIEDTLHFLELPGAIFKADITAAEEGARGSDGVSFLFSATGGDPVDVGKCASGGELSRIMLCLKEMMARLADMPTMVFDEIDSGVSGSVADKMGSMICRMGGNMQVFAITHLPQVAAKGSAHYVVTKDTGVFGTSSKMEKLSDERRVLEIARMLSGSSLTEAAIANAKSLLGYRL